MASVLIQKHLELRVGVPTVQNFCCDDGSGVANSMIVLEILEEAQDIAEGILKKGWPLEEDRVRLLEEDRAVRGAAIDIAIGIMGRRRPELLSSDAKTGSLYDGWRRDGERVLERIAVADRRARGEDAANGPAMNAHVAQGATVPSATPTQAPMVFLQNRRTGYTPRGTY